MTRSIRRERADGRRWIVAWRQDREIHETSETCRVAINKAARYVKDTTEQVTPVTADVPDATEHLNSEFKRVKESEEQFLGFHDVLEPLTQKVAIARDEGRLAEEAALKAKSACENPRIARKRAF